LTATAIDGDNRPTAVVGLGSPWGDDRVGWEVMARLRHRLAPGDWAEALTHPLHLLDIPPHYRQWIIVDASRGGGSPGTIQRLIWPDARLMAARTVSSHGLDLAVVLELAMRLGRLPPRVVIFTIEGAATAFGPAATVSAPVAAAIPTVVAHILAEIAGEQAMPEPVTVEWLKSLAFLAAATDAELQALLPSVQKEHYPAGTMLFREGDQLNRVFIVADGRVALEVLGPDHRPRRFQTLSRGELLGWSPLLGSAPMTASARALTDVTVAAIDARGLLALCDNDPRFGYHFMKRTVAALAARLQATRLQLLDVYRAELAPLAMPDEE
jgi:hydrogenase maturation protease